MKRIKWDKLIIKSPDSIIIKCGDCQFTGRRRSRFFTMSNGRYGHIECCQLLFGPYDNDNLAAGIRLSLQQEFQVSRGAFPESDDPLDFLIRYFKKYHKRGGFIVDYGEI